MTFEIIREMLNDLPELEAWPELPAIFERAGSGPRPDWELPLVAAAAVGASKEVAYCGAAAIACLQLSIILVDDMLDDDPRGPHHKMGFGNVANMAAALQSAAFRLLYNESNREKTTLEAINALASVALATAAGQNLDVQNLQGEENYWTVTTAKSTPFYGGALQIGALLGGSGEALAKEMYNLGVILGEIIQIEDDLEDALEIPANADWKQGRNNLLILYAKTAEHPNRQIFLDLLPHIDDLETLKAAQQILATSGAISYSVYLLVERYQKSRRLLTAMKCPNPTAIMRILDDYAQSLVTILKVSGVDISIESLNELVS